MAQSAPLLVLVAGLLINTISCCSAENVYCVTPTPTSCSSCPQNSINCSTLSEYAQKAALYFTSNTTIVFLPGDHTLDAIITVADVDGLTMCGDSFSGNIVTVLCSGLVGLSFKNMVDFKIYDLAFTNCSRNSVFYPLSNSALVIQSTQSAKLNNCFFHHNLGTPLVVMHTNITLTGTKFTQNRYNCDSDCIGAGAIAAFSSNLTFTGNTTFLENNTTSPYGGGAIYASENALLSFNGINNFINNLAYYSGGTIYASGDALLSFNGISNFINNKAVGDSAGGGAIYASDNHYAVLSFNGNNNFINNSAGAGAGAIFTNTNSTLTFNGTINIVSNGHYGSGIDTLNTTYGGGMWIGLKCTFSVFPNTTMYWENNYANLGGAIYVVDTSPISYCASVAKYVPKEECFFQLPGQNLSNGIDVQLVFRDNSADIAGSVLYGGVIDNCKLIHALHSYSSGKVFNMLVHSNGTDYNTTSNISSDPLHICPCENNHPYCIGSQYDFPNTVYPGETFQASLVAAGQRDGTVPSTVRSILNQNVNPGHLSDSQYLQQANTTCTKLNYTVFSLNQSVNIMLYAENHSPCNEFELQITIQLNQTCPPGFYRSESVKAKIYKELQYYKQHWTNNTSFRPAVLGWL